MDCQEILKSMTNDELMAGLDQAWKELAAAATNQTESEWHEACFAGVMAFTFEARERGLHLKRVK